MKRWVTGNYSQVEARLCAYFNMQEPCFGNSSSSSVISGDGHPDSGTKGAPGSESRTGPRLVSPAAGGEKNYWNLL